MCGRLIAAFSLFCLVSPIWAVSTDLPACNQLAEQENERVFDIKVDCPRVYQTLQQRDLRVALETPLPDKITQAQLKFLLKSVQGPVDLWPLDEAGLNELLAGILTDQGDADESTWWKQLLDWLKSFKPEKYASEYDWLVRFLEAVTPSEKVARLLLYAVFGVTILMAAGLVIWEFYLAGLFSRRKKKALHSDIQQALSGIESREVKSLTEIRQLAPDLQVVALFNNVISHLTAKKLLPGNPALTNSELKEHLQKHKSLAYTAFTCLVDNVEPVLYGKLTPSAPTLENCWENAQQILTQ